MVNRSISPGIRAAVLDRDGHRCSYCGSTYNLSIDHIIPVAKGGTSNIENLCTLCSYCNTSKGSGDRPRTISSERDRVRHMRYMSSVLSDMQGDWFTMTRDELTKALVVSPIRF
jgi:HNH endonuclease